jgi:hypothetical protein
MGVGGCSQSARLPASSSAPQSAVPGKQQRPQPAEQAEETKSIDYTTDT